MNKVFHTFMHYFKHFRTVSLPFLASGLSILATIFMLSGCAGALAFRDGNALLAEGKTEEGLSKLELAVKHEPRNAEYRITLATNRASIINNLLSRGDAAKREGRLSDAEKAFRQTQNIDANNTMAKQGIDSIVIERRHRQILVDAESLLKKGGGLALDEALDKIRSVLSENPSQKDALNLRSRVEEARAKASKPESKLAAIYKKPITLEFRDAPLKAVFDMIAKVSGLNFFFDKDIRPDIKATIFVKNTSIEDAVRLLLVTNQLEQKILGANSILIYPGTPQKQKDYQTLSMRTFFLTNADVKAVSNSIKTIVKTKDLVVDERLGIIIMRDTPEAVRMAERIVALQDLSDPEVMLEVEVMEIKRTRLLELGIRWPEQVSLSPLVVSGSALTLTDLRNMNESTTQAVVGSMVINARKEDQNVNVLANPRIRVRNKDKAKFMIGDRVPVITTTSTSTGFVSESVSYVDVGLKLEVEPSIYLDDEVGIKVGLEVSNIVKEVTSKSGTLTYQLGSRNAATTLRIKDGETQILAGLINDDERSTANKVPLLGELPVAGRLFGSDKNDKQRSEILLSITPHVVRSIRRPDLIDAEFDSGTEANIGVPSLYLSTVEPEKTDVTGGKPAAPAPGAVQSANPPSTKAAEPAAVIIAATPATAVSATPSAVAAPMPAVQNASPIQGALSFSWQTQAQVKVGEQFSAVLRVNSQGALRGMPLLVGFDPQMLQVVSVQEGDFFKQGGATTNFSQRIDPMQGKVLMAVVRQSVAGNDSGINGAGGLATLTFKALKSGNAKLQLQSATPEPMVTTPFTLPVEQLVKLLP